jgi:N-acetyl-anhydromuramyl-L-alanine amidase AmpD
MNILQRGRKTDPGPFFNWDDYQERYQKLRSESVQTVDEVN